MRVVLGCTAVDPSQEERQIQEPAERNYVADGVSSPSLPKSRRTSFTGPADEPGNDELGEDKIQQAQEPPSLEHR